MNSIIFSCYHRGFKPITVGLSLDLRFAYRVCIVRTERNNNAHYLHPKSFSLITFILTTVCHSTPAVHEEQRYMLTNNLKFHLIEKRPVSRCSFNNLGVVLCVIVGAI